MKDEKLMTDLKSVAPNLPCISYQIFRFPRLVEIILSWKKGTVRVDLLEKDETVDLKESNLKQLKESIYILIGK